MTRVSEYIRRKEEGIVRIQGGIQKKAEDMDRGVQEIVERNEVAVRKIQVGIVRKAEDLNIGIDMISRRIRKFAEEWY